jgi:aspartate-semialdehyde dehydrogenase
MAALASSSSSASASAATGLTVGIAGCTGAVGAEMISTLHRRGFPCGAAGSVRLFASARSAGRSLATPWGDVVIELFSVAAARQTDVMFLAVSGGFAKQHARALGAMPGGCVVIDNSSAFRYDDSVPLVVPEINAGAAEGHRLIANPNCTTAIAAVALWPLHRAFGLKKVIVSTYQASSGAGAAGMEELRAGTAAVLAGEPCPAETFAHPLAFNVIPHIDAFQDNGYTREELKVMWETRKIFRTPDLLVSCTAVRVPTLRAHAESIVVETEKDVTPEAARELLRAAPGVTVKDDVAGNVYPMPLNASNCDDVEVGRVRQSLIFGSKGLELFVCGDQLLKGAALNAVQIAEVMLEKGWLGQ